ncbi:hypothetical protein [Bradyrhizobium tunisiense]|uniref:hypothetical protein n=1 Tax=Bradyrhizobium tunisiense TaxID=3278709 RepID=UPI0035D70C12
MEKPEKLGVTVAFTSEMGRFYGIWATTELTVDFAICKLLSVPHEEGHLITAGVGFNQRARLLQALVKRKNAARGNEIIDALRTIQNESLRNTFAHSFLTGNEKTVEFVERSRHGLYNPKVHQFTLEEFQDHVQKFWQAGQKLFAALGDPYEEFQQFAEAAIHAASSERTSSVLQSDKT